MTPDVNTLVEATIGPAGALIAAWVEGSLDLVTCEAIVSEFEDVLRRPHIRGKYARISNETIATSAAALRNYTVFTSPSDIPRVSQDPDDDVVLACAQSGRADYIVSRDPHLLVLEAYQGIPIVTPEAFLPVLRNQTQETPPDANP